LHGSPAVRSVSRGPLPAMLHRRRHQPVVRSGVWEDDELPMADFEDMDVDALREFKKGLQISDDEWKKMGLPEVDFKDKVVKVEQTEADEKLDQQAFQYVLGKLKEFRENRDMGAVELGLVLMAGLDAQDATAMTYEDEVEDSSEREKIVNALKHIIDTNTIPDDRDGLRQLATELARMPMLDPATKSEKMKQYQAYEQGMEYEPEQKKPLTPQEIGGIAAVWGVTAIPVFIGLTALYILYTSAGQQVQ